MANMGRAEQFELFSNMQRMLVAALGIDKQRSADTPVARDAAEMPATSKTAAVQRDDITAPAIEQAPPPDQRAAPVMVAPNKPKPTVQHLPTARSHSTNTLTSDATAAGKQAHDPPAAEADFAAKRPFRPTLVSVWTSHLESRRACRWSSGR